MKSHGYLILGMILATPLVGSADWYTRWDEAGNTWSEKWNNVLNIVDTLPLDERSELLAKAVTLGSDGVPSGDKKNMFDRAQAILLSTSGHAKYYQDKIETMRTEVVANSKKSNDEISKMQDEGFEVANAWAYDSFCVNAFRILANLPSPESVAVLGFYLNDPVGRNGKTLLGDKRQIPSDDFGPRPINSEGAATAIRNLGIEHPPFKAPVGREREDLREGEVDAWKNWWDDVKEGRRTYRFIGSKIEYGPDGPASIEVIQRAQRNMKRDEERAAGHKKSSSVSEPASVITQIRKPSSIAAILAACALVAAAVWYFLKCRKEA